MTRSVWSEQLASPLNIDPYHKVDSGKIVTNDYCSSHGMYKMMEYTLLLPRRIFLLQTCILGLFRGVLKLWSWKQTYSIYVGFKVSLLDFFYTFFIFMVISYVCVYSFKLLVLLLNNKYERFAYYSQIQHLDSCGIFR